MSCNALYALLLYILVALGMTMAEEECTCIIALVSDTSFETENQLYQVRLMDSNQQCDQGSSERCNTKCKTGFLRSTGNGDLTSKSRRSNKTIGQLLCEYVGRDLESRDVGLFYRTCQDQVRDSEIRAMHPLCCSGGLFTDC